MRMVPGYRRIGFRALSVGRVFALSLAHALAATVDPVARGQKSSATYYLKRAALLGAVAAGLAASSLLIDKLRGPSITPRRR
jgi:hypothetical protein